MTQRERWYRYWHAKRKFERHHTEMLTQALVYGQSIDRVDESHPCHEYVRRAIDYAINPPIIIDPELTCFKPMTTTPMRARYLP